MNSEDHSIEREIVKDFAEATSTQTRVSNRAWITLMVFSIFVLLPKMKNSGVQLPFGLVVVPEGQFYIIALPFLCVLMIAFCAAYAQEVRASRIAQNYIDKCPKLDKLHPRDLFDILRVPNVNRVAALPQLIRRQYFSIPKKTGLLIRRIAALFYVILKIMASTVYLGLPIYAQTQALNRFQEIPAGSLPTSWLIVAVYALFIMSLFTIILVVIWELIQIYIAGRTILRSNSEEAKQTN
jgi:hypothetical protein